MDEKSNLKGLRCFLMEKLTELDEGKVNLKKINAIIRMSVVICQTYHLENNYQGVLDDNSEKKRVS